MWGQWIENLCSQKFQWHPAGIISSNDKRLLFRNNWFGTPRNVILFTFKAVNSSRLLKTVVDWPQQCLQLVHIYLYSPLVKPSQWILVLALSLALTSGTLAKVRWAEISEAFSLAFVGTLLPYGNKLSLGCCMMRNTWPSYPHCPADIQLTEWPEAEWPRWLAGDYRHMTEIRRKTAQLSTSQIADSELWVKQMFFFFLKPLVLKWFVILQRLTYTRANKKFLTHL